MDPFYLEIRLTHIGAVIISGALMLVRGLAFNVTGAAWAKSWPVRYLSYTVDTVLLTAALMLTTIVRQYPFADSWVTVKLVFVVVYMVLGYLALSASRSGTRWGSLGAAVLAYAFIVSVARSRDAFGFFA